MTQGLGWVRAASVALCVALAGCAKDGGGKPVGETEQPEGAAKKFTIAMIGKEADQLYALLGRLQQRGVTCIFVSHRMPEIFRLCDTVSVLRDGLHVSTRRWPILRRLS